MDGNNSDVEKSKKTYLKLQLLVSFLSLEEQILAKKI
jgi:hypothetical protein